MNARRKEEESPNSSVVAETMKLLAKRSYGYQNILRSRHTVTKYLRDEKAHRAIKKIFEFMYYINDQLYSMEVVGSDMEHKEPIIVDFFYPAMCKVEIATALVQLFVTSIAMLQGLRSCRWIQTLSV